MNEFFGKLFNGNLSPAAGDDAEAPTPSVPLYLAGLLVQVCSLLIVARQLGDMRFGYFAVALSLLGAAVAYYLRLRQAPKRYIQYGVLIVGAIFLMGFRGLGVFGELLPYEAQGSQELTIVSGLALASAFCTFLWLSDESVVFTCVWAIAIVGLTGTVNINRELILGFAVFLAAAVFLLVHQNAIFQSGSVRETTEGAAADAGFTRFAWPQLRSQLMVAVTVWAAALLLGFVIAIPVQMLGRNLSLNAIIQRLKVPPTPTGRGISGRARLMFDNLNQFNVGLGPVDDDPTDRMYALSDKPHYWRGRVYDQYTGQSPLAWNYSLEGSGRSLFPVGVDTPEGMSRFELRPVLGLRQKTTKVTHRFHLQGGIFGPLYHAAEAKAVRAPVTAIVQRADNTIGTGRGMGADYEVDSEVIDPLPSELRNAGTNYPAEIARRYLNLGPSNDALAQLAREAVGNANNPYDRTQALRRFVAARCIYTREARAVPRDRDPAEFFLNESKEGYCDLYATSLTILCRYAGLPSRIATGFAPGNLATDATVPKVAPGDARQWYKLTGSDLHAWTEVYFVGYGWVPFDATQDTGGSVTPTQTPKPIVKPNLFQEFWRNGGAALVFAGLAGIALIFVVLNELRGRLLARRELYALGKGQSAEVARVYQNTVRRFGKRGLPRPPTMTPAEFLRRARDVFNETVTEPLSSLTAVTERALYTQDGATDDDLRAAAAESRKTLSALRSHPKSGSGSQVAGRREAKARD